MVSDHFNPRSPRGERHFRATKTEYNFFISIHAPREGSDNYTFQQSVFLNKFQSTLPARGATFLFWEIQLTRVYFNPRSPRGERPRKAMDELSKCVISIHAPREGSDSNIAQIFTIRTAILQHGYQTRLVFGTKSIVLNRKKSFKLPVFLREPTGLFMFTSGSRHGRSKNQRVGHIYGGACTDVLNLSLI